VALEAARAAALRVGLTGAHTRVLHDANNTLVLLPDERVVAKVATAILAERGDHPLRQELAVGAHLAGRGAPVVSPLPGQAGGPHEVNGVLVTLWNYQPQSLTPRKLDLELPKAMRALHVALADYPGQLPPFTEKVDGACALFADERKTVALARSDRALAGRVYERLRPRLAAVAARSPLHGEPHVDNVLWTDAGPLFIDFESACVGPREWDLAYLPHDARRGFRNVDEGLTGLCRLAISFCVAAWCSAQRGRSRKIDQAAELHLDVLRQS
jgi:predicted trehalose synthase